MSACCVPGCKNRYSATSKLKFYRIPSGRRPFQANRRRLWLRAIGSSEDIKGSARICGAHFVSGEASLDHDSPDFVPSVFESSKRRRRVKRPYRLRRRRRHRATGKPAPPEDDSSVDLQLFAYLESESELLDATETTSDPSVPKEEETLTKTDEETSSTKNLSPSAYTNKLDATSPFVLLRSVVSPEGGFQCELCTQVFISVSELLKHKEAHKEEKQTFICEICGKHLIGQTDFAEHQHVHVECFPCNVCHRSFTTSQNLKRHKLLHVKDGRKCPMCGVLFCRRHNHVSFLPKPDSVSDSGQDCSSIEPQNLSSDLMSESRQVEKCTSSAAPAPEKPMLKTIFSLPRPPPPVLKYPRTSSLRKAALSSQHAAFIQPPPPKHSDLPVSLQVFSPLYLTSASLEVKRNYEYILNKPKKIKKETVKEEDVEQPLFCLNERTVRQVRKQRIAYDMEIVL